jgi:hypothetical protein
MENLMGKENTTLPFTRWKESVKESDKEYSRPRDKQQLRGELDATAKEPPLLTGSCLCGAIHYEATPPFGRFQLCFCSRCQKFTGSAHASNLLLRIEQFRWTQGEEQLGRFALPDAQFFATSFCKVCGSSLPWENQPSTYVIVPVGTLDVDPEVRPERTIFWESRAAWYVPPHELPTFAELPPRR